MKKYVLAMVLLITLATGCQSPFAETMVLLDEPIAEVHISKSMGFGEMNEDLLFNFNDDKTIEVFEKAIMGAERIADKVDLSEPEYNLAIVYEGGLPSHAIYLWLGDENEESMMMYLTNEETAYATSARATNHLRELLLSE